MSRQFGTVTVNTKEVRESPQEVLPGESPTFSITIDGTGTILSDASLTMKLFKGGHDISGTNLTGSLSVLQMTITTKKITGLVGGNDYVFYVYFTLNGIPTGRYCRIICPKEGAF